jgi:DNA polymerase III sliding clamp (beta) subunit (PCNA family)
MTMLDTTETIVPARVLLDTREFLPALRFALYSASTEETRYYLCTVALHLDHAGLHVVSTDGHRLHCTTIHAACDEGLSRKAPRVIALKVADVRDILKTYGTKKAQVDIGFAVDYDAGDVRVYRKGDLVATYSRMDCTYPDWQRVVPRASNLEPVFGTFGDRLLPFLNAAIGGSEGSPHVRFVASKEADTLALSIRIVPRGANRSRDAVSISATLPQAGANRDLEIGFNAAYVRDIVRAFGPQAPLVMMGQDAWSPVVWRMPEARRKLGWLEQYAVLMPCRV